MPKAIRGGGEENWEQWDAGEGFNWETAPWFDANGLRDIAPMGKESVVQQLQNRK